ncbi:MAG: glycosyltransferase [bacterium]|nr:glycosyltransferase [bacterium]
MKIHILYSFQSQPWGGGNQFLKALKHELENQGLYEETLQKADVILFNSHHGMNEVFKAKKKFSGKVFIHRIDGPLYLTRGSSKDLDILIHAFNGLVADGTVFQSAWCKAKNTSVFKLATKYETVIPNASDRGIFTKQEKVFNPAKVRLIASSWSSNWQKGFEIYKYLDDYLDFSKYEMTFVGNSPVAFNNITQIEPVHSKELAEILHRHDIYITASQNDPCSNSLIEALSCGLPAVALRDGGHPELVGGGGELFNSPQDLLEKIEKVAHHYSGYQSRIAPPVMEAIARRYYEFARHIHQEAANASYIPKQIKLRETIRFYKIKLMMLTARIKQKIFR